MDRGRTSSRQRELDERYDEEMGLGGSSTRSTNPFGDDAAVNSIRGVSPRPMVDTQAASQKTHKSQNSLEPDNNSPNERRSMFRENM